MELQYICKYCGKICKNKNSLTQHEIRCKQNPKRIEFSGFGDPNYTNPYHQIGHKGANKYTKAKRLGLPKPEVSNKTREKLSKASKNRKMSEDEKFRRSIAMQIAVKNHPESYSSSNVNGRVKHVYYNDIKLDSSWEYEVAKSLDENNIKWERPKNYFTYYWNNGEHKYFPDFYLTDLDIYIEVKGYERERDKIKYKSVKNLIVIKNTEIDKIKNNSNEILNLLNI